MRPTISFPPKHRPSKAAAFQLAELLLSIFIFSLVVAICFFAAASGFRIFANTSSRQTLQRDARAIFAWLQRDVGLSNLIRCKSARREQDSNRRDALAVAAMDSWEPLQTDALGLPSWDRVVVYVATRDSQGLLLRQLFAAPTIPLDAYMASLMLGKALSGETSPRDQRRLSGSVKSFSVDLSEARNTAVFDLILSENTVHGGSGHARKEVLEVQTTIFPHNTWPRL